MFFLAALLFLGGKTLKMAPTMTFESLGADFGSSQNLGPSPLSNMQPKKNKKSLIYIIISQSVCVCPNTPNSLISQQILELSICMDSLGHRDARKKY